MSDDLHALVVQSQSALAAVIRRVIERAGLQATVACDCDLAFEILAREQQPLVLVEYHDLAMAEPGFRQLLQTRRAGGTLVGVLATSLERGISEWAREGLWDFVLLKPFSPTELRLKLRSKGWQLPTPADWFLPATPAATSKTTVAPLLTGVLEI